MSSRGGIIALNGEQSQSAKTPVSTKVVKESLKSIILSGESDLNKFVSHRILYILGFVTGWNARIFSLEFLPLLYFFIWAIVMFGLRENHFGYMFLIADVIILIYFLFLHSVISAWDRIKKWFINRARKQGGIENMTLVDIKYLLIYTRKVFGVKYEISEEVTTDFNPIAFRKLLKSHKAWQYALNVSVIFELIIITGLGVYAFILDLDVLSWIINWWYFIFVILIPIFIIVICLSITKSKIKSVINTIPEEKFEEILRVLNDFEVFGRKSTK
ncbi:MAG: hypothetical protein GPJ52_06205 [Candidatus Heimdallarchaeota archaeon]|nr:hypothetical protein [Candidatus Heimdallarchaeota archaeon]